MWFCRLLLQNLPRASVWDCSILCWVNVKPKDWPTNNFYSTRVKWLFTSLPNKHFTKAGGGSGYRWGVYFYTSPILVVGLFSTLIEALDASLEALNRSNMNLEYCHIPKLCDDFHIILKCNRNNFLDKKISIIRYSFSTDNDFVIWLSNVYLVLVIFMISIKNDR